MRKKLTLLQAVVGIVILLLLYTFIPRNSSNDTQHNNGGDIAHIVIGVPNWSSAMTTAYILREILREDFGIEAHLQAGTNEEIYTGIINGTIHIHPEGWTPNHDKWLTHLRDKLERNKNGTEAAQGLCIDKTLAEQYNITHIRDLQNPGIAQYFDTDGDGKGEIWIGAEEWSTTAIEQIRAKSYGYDTMYELLQTDEETALERLEKATATGKLFAIHCYTPHWMWHQHDLYRLQEPAHNPSKWKVVLPSEDPQWLEKSTATVAWEPATLHIYYTKALREQYPTIAHNLQKTRFTMEEILQITYDIEKGNWDPATYAQQWVQENRY